MRVELFFKTPSDLTALLRFLITFPPHPFTAFNIPNKEKSDQILENVKEIQRICPQANVCAHYSIKHNVVKAGGGRKVENKSGTVSGRRNINRNKTAENFIRTTGEEEISGMTGMSTDLTSLASFERFRAFLDDAERAGCAEILVVSGSGPKKPFNSLTCIQMLAQQAQQAQRGQKPVRLGNGLGNNYALKIAVAFNPYFEDPQLREIEMQRIQSKLETRIVTKVYIQFGSNTAYLKQGLQQLTAIIKSLHEKHQDEDNGNNHSKTETHVQIVGSIFLPSKQLLARMKFRPWNGVFLSHEFLDSVDNANKIVKEIMGIYREFQIEPLIETAFKTEQEARAMMTLLMIQETQRSSGLKLTGPDFNVPPEKQKK